MPKILFLHPSCQKSCHHRIPCAHSIYQRSLRRRSFIYCPVLCRQHCSFPSHRHQHILCAHFLKLSCIRNHRLPVPKFHLKDFSQLMVIGLHQKRTVLQHIQQQILCRIHHSRYASALQPLQNPSINIIWHRAWNTPCKHKHILFSQYFQLLHQLCHRRFADFRTAAVNLCPVNRLQFQVDSRNAIRHHDEIRTDSHMFHLTNNLFARKSRRKSQSGIFNSEIPQHCRNINSLTSRQHQLRTRPVRYPQFKILHRNDIIQ